MPRISYPSGHEVGSQNHLVTLFSRYRARSLHSKSARFKSQSSGTSKKYPTGSISHCNPTMGTSSWISKDVYSLPTKLLCVPFPFRVRHLQRFLFVDHFHVHIVNVNYEGGLPGMAVGRAHLLDDVISLVSRCCPENDAWSSYKS